MNELWDRWWNGSDLLGWILPILALVGVGAVAGATYVVIHFVTKYW